MIASEGENIIPDHVGLAIMLVKAAVSRAVNEVALGENAAAAFIEINAPAAVSNSGDIMPKVVDDAGARLLAERINSAHIAQDGAIAVRFNADVMNVVELDKII